MEYYIKLINYCKSISMSINLSEKERILWNIKKYKSKIKRDEMLSIVLDTIIKESKNLDRLVEYDMDKESHIDVYEKYCLEDELFGYRNDASTRVFNRIQKCNLWSEEYIKQFINRIVDMTNAQIESIDNLDGQLSKISAIENTIEILNSIVANKSLQKKYIEKVLECIRKLLYVKRKHINSRSFVEEAKEFKQSFEIPLKEIQKIKDDVRSNIATLYNHSRINFCRQMENAIKSYSESALLYHISTINVRENGTYNYDKNQNNTEIIKQYFDNVGKDYVIKHQSDLINVLSENYYEVMIKYIKRSYELQIGLLADILKDDINIIRKSMNDARINKKEMVDDIYVEMMTQIIGIEYNIGKLVEKNHVKAKSICKILEELFYIYKKNDLYRDGIMYIFFMLYCKEGYGYRNKIAHGEVLGQENYNRELLIIYSCVIIINYIVGVEDSNGRK